MAQVLAAGLAEVLRDHDDKIAAAQAWCVRKNIGSIEELRGKGDAAIEEFLSAAGIVEFLHQFIVKRRIGDYAAVASAPAAAKDPRIIGPNSKPMSPVGSIANSSLFERLQADRDANSSIDSSDDEASTSSGFGALLAGRDPPAVPDQAPPGFAEEMAARMAARPAAAADPEEGS